MNNSNHKEKYKKEIKDLLKYHFPEIIVNILVNLFLDLQVYVHRRRSRFEEFYINQLILKGSWRDFPGGPVVKSPCFQCRGWGFDPWLGN